MFEHLSALFRRINFYIFYDHTYIFFWLDAPLVFCFNVIYPPFHSLVSFIAIQHDEYVARRSVSINSPLLELNKLKGSLCQCAPMIGVVAIAVLCLRMHACYMLLCMCAL